MNVTRDFCCCTVELWRNVFNCCKKNEEIEIHPDEHVLLPISTTDSPCAPSSMEPIFKTDDTNWITPKEQLDRCLRSVVSRIQNAVAWPLECSRVVAEYVDDPAIYSLRAFEQLEALPPLIPPLPENIHDILDQDCPILPWYKGPLKVGTTHLLVLVPQEFRSLNYFIKNLFEPGRKKLPHLGCAPIFCQFEDQEKYGDTTFKTSHWALLSMPFLNAKDSWIQKNEAIDQLNKKLGVNYKIPDLQQIAIGAIVHKIINPPKLNIGQCSWHDSHFSAILKETNESNRHLSFAAGCEFRKNQIVINYVNFEDCSHVAVLREL